MTSMKRKMHSSLFAHLADKLVKLERVGMNLYVSKPPTSMKAENALKIYTVNENKIYTQHQFESRAKQACDLYHALGMPSIKDFQAILCMNGIN